MTKSTLTLNLKALNRDKVLRARRTGNLSTVYVSSESFEVAGYVHPEGHFSGQRNPNPLYIQVARCIGNDLGLPVKARRALLHCISTLRDTHRRYQS